MDTERALRSVAIAAIVLVAGSSAPIHPDNGSDPVTEIDDRRTAHFVFNNRNPVAYNVSVFLIEKPNASREFFPVEVTLQNGTRRTHWRQDGLPPVPGPDRLRAVRMEPARGTLVEVHRTLPPLAALHVAIAGAPDDATSLTVVYRTGTHSVPIRSVGFGGTICTGTDATVQAFDARSSSSETCGNVSDVEFPESLVRATAEVPRSGSVATDER